MATDYKLNSIKLYNILENGQGIGDNWDNITDTMPKKK